METRRVVVGIDNGGTTNNATVLDSGGRFLVDQMVEMPSRVKEGPHIAIEALAEAFDHVLSMVGLTPASVLSVGLDTPGPASADGVISSRGSTNFAHPDWRGYNVRAALEERLKVPVVYNNDGNSAALYAHHQFFIDASWVRSSVCAIVGTGLGGGVVERGSVVRGASGQAGELGHILIPMRGLLEDGQPIPLCNCGNKGDVESVASLTGIERNLLPFWLSRFPDHPLREQPVAQAAKLVRGYGEAGDPMARAIFEQQAKAIGALFTIAANFTDPDAYFLGGGVVDAQPDFRLWFLDQVREHTAFREEQARAASLGLIPDLDMAGARGSAIAALAMVTQS